MSKKEKFEKNVETAVKWLATEHNFFLELKKDLAELKEAVEIAKYESSVQGIKKVLHDLNYWWRAERRFNRYYTNARSLAKKLKEKAELPAEEKEEWNKLIAELDIEAAHLIRDCSRYDGELHRLFTHLDTVLQKKDFEQAQQIVVELEMTAQEAEKWIEALAIDLKKAKQLAEEFSEVYHESIEGIQQVIAPLTPKAKVDYLVHLLKQGQWMRRGLMKDVVELLVKIVSPSFVEDESNRGELIKLAEKLAKEREWEPAAMIYARMAGQRMYDLKRTAELYEKAGKLLLAAEYYERSCAHLFSEFLKYNGDNYLSKDDNINLTSMYKMYLKVAWIYQKFGKKSKARESAERAAECYLLAATYCDNSSSFSRYKGKREAFRILRQVGYSSEEAWAKIGDMFRWPEHKAEAYERAGEWEKAAEYWEKKVAQLINDADKAKLKEYKEKAAAASALTLSTAQNYQRSADNVRSETYYKEYTEKAAYFYAKNISEAKDWEEKIAKFTKDIAAGKTVSNSSDVEKYKEKAAAALAKSAKKLMQTKKTTKEEQTIAQGDSLFQQKKYSDAIKKYESAKAWDKVADCYNQLGQGVQAMAFYKKAVEEFHKKFGFDKVKEHDLPASVELDVFVLGNLKKASSNYELKKVLQEIIPMIKGPQDASLVILRLQELKVIQADDWRALGRLFEQLNLPAHAAECYMHAGTMEDNQKAVELYRRMKDKGLAVMMAWG